MMNDKSNAEAKGLIRWYLFPFYTTQGVSTAVQSPLLFSNQVGYTYNDARVKGGAKPVPLAQLA